MADMSALDKKYFVDRTVYNCPFCNRNNVPFTITTQFAFNWSEAKDCFGFIVKCYSCDSLSMHLSYEDITGYLGSRLEFVNLPSDKELDEIIFYSVPTSFFTIDERIPRVICELLTETEGSLKMNFLTGASACVERRYTN